jgi:hypothetical protein
MGGSSTAETKLTTAVSSRTYRCQECVRVESTTSVGRRDGAGGRRGRGGGRWQAGSELVLDGSASLKDLISPLDIILAAGGVVDGICSLPERDTAELGVTAVLVDDDLGLDGVQVVARQSSTCSSREADIELHLGVDGRHTCPLVIGDVIGTGINNVIVASPGRAGLCVIELDKQEVEPSRSNGRTEVSIRDHALRSGGEVVALGLILRKEGIVEVVGHSTVATRLVIRDGVAIRIDRGRIGERLNIKVESVDDGISEGARNSRVISRTKRLPEKGGKLDGLRVVCNEVSGGTAPPREIMTVLPRP